MTALLEVEDLHLAFRTEGGLARVLDGANFRIDAGQVFINNYGAGGGIEGAARLRADPRGQREALDRRGADPERRAGRLAVEAGRVA